MNDMGVKNKKEILARCKRYLIDHQTYFHFKDDLLTVIFPMIELLLRVEEGGVEKKEYSFRADDNYDAAFKNGFNSAIDLCNAHLVKKLEGIEEVINNELTLLKHDIPFFDKQPHSIIIKELTQAIITHLTEKEKYNVSKNRI